MQMILPKHLLVHICRGSTAEKKISKYSDWSHFSGGVLMGHIYYTVKLASKNVSSLVCDHCLTKFLFS